jgi:hypothetical protein
MNYQDFVLQLDRAPGGQGFLTRVIRSPAGEAEAPFVNPISTTELDGLWWTALAARQANRDLKSNSTLSTSSPLAAELSLEDLGDRLFQALFQGPVRSCWARSLAESEQLAARGLRLKLQLNVADPHIASLVELPWECLFSAEQGGFLGLQRKTPILRHLRLPLPVGQAPVAQPLRILTVSSQPRSMPPLALGDEGEKIIAALGNLPGVETLQLHNPSVEDLREALLQREFHVLHFMGHGGFDPKSGQGLLYFTGRDGFPVPVSGTLLASHLASLSTLRLVFVNACETARASARAPFAGVATALLRVGVLAVIAMQRPIQDGSALEFSRTVYHRLAAGDPIDAAVTEGRLAIARGHGALLEWGTPVLFLRAEDGWLFASASPAGSVEIPPLMPPQVSSAVPPPVRSHRPLTSLLLAGGLALGLAGSLQLFRATTPETRQEGAMTSDPPSTDVPLITTDTRSPSPQRDPSEQKKDRPDRQREPTKEKSEKTPRLAPHPNSSYTVSEGSPASVPALNAEVGANFYEREGHAFARFWITPPGEGMLQPAPVVGPGPIEFPTQNGTYRLDVLSLDLTQKRATVHLSLLPRSP